MKPVTEMKIEQHVDEKTFNQKKPLEFHYKIFSDIGLLDSLVVGCSLLASFCCITELGKVSNTPNFYSVRKSFLYNHRKQHPEPNSPIELDMINHQRKHNDVELLIIRV